MTSADERNAQFERRKLVGTGTRCYVSRVVPAAPGRTSGATANAVAVVELPVVLAGPILRRTSAEGAWVFLVTSVPVAVRGSLRNESTGQWIGGGGGSSTWYGDRMHITLFRLAGGDGTGRLPLDTVLGYQLYFACTTERYTITEGCIYTREEVALGSYELPTFVIPSPRHNSALRFIHMSCRKPHGEGYDAMKYALDLLESRATEARQRPAFAMLTGDQVYADDVHNYILARARTLAWLLAGRPENVPGVYAPLTRVLGGESLHRGEGAFTDRRRGTIVRESDMTTDHGANHVLGFYEFASLYLLAWSPYPAIHLDLRRPSRDNLATFIESHHFRPDLALKFLANIPSYMTFDDHEITDDWNITATVQRNTRTNVTARRVIANGIAAFWVFQFKGNDPLANVALDAPIRARIRQIAAGVDPEPPPVPSPPTMNHPVTRTAPPSEDPFDRAMWDHHDWFFRPPVPIPIISLDTRTMRAFDAPQWGARLLNSAALAKLSAHLDAIPAAGNPVVFIISAAPFIGWSDLEEFVQRLATNVAQDGEQLNLEHDPEPWSYNPAGMISMLEVLHASRHRRFVFLSGDVHYAFNAVASWRRCGGSKIVDLVQLVSSATKNEMSSGSHAGMHVAGAAENDDPQVRYCRNNDLAWIRESLDGFEPFQPAFSILRFKYFDAITMEDTINVRNNIGEIVVENGDRSLRLTHVIHAETDRGTETSVEHRWNWTWDDEGALLRHGLRPRPDPVRVEPSDGGVPIGGVPDPADGGVP